MPGSKRNRKYLRWISFIVILSVTIICIFSVQLFRIRKEIKAIPEATATLREMGLKALETKDVPVGAILLYKGDMIGQGYNRVKRDTNLAAHAEIEAMNDAVRRMGWEGFKKLDRADLVLVTSYEPCEMCKGAMVHYDIHKTVFLKDKPFMMWLKTYRRSLLYELGKRQSEGEELQDSLFMLHPDFPGRSN